MRHIPLGCLLTFGVLLTALPLRALPEYNWSYRFGGTNVNTAYDAAVDASGNVVIVGTFAGSMNLGGATLTAAGDHDIFIARFNAAGAHLWSQSFGGAGLDGAHAVTVDAAGNITMTGYYRAPVSIGGVSLGGSQGLDIFVARFDAAGAHQWSRGFASLGADEGQGIVSDDAGNVIVTGSYGGAINFGGGSLPLFGGLDAFLVKLDANGVHQWSKGFGAGNSDIGYAVAADASGNILLTGQFMSAVNFGGGALTSAGASDVFVAKFGSDGTHQWSARRGGTAVDKGQGVGSDASGRVVITGIHNGTFLASYDTDGVPLWNQTFTSTDMVQGLDLDVSDDGMVALTGNLRGTANFGGGALKSAGDDDIFVAVCEANGTHRWSQRFGSTGDDWGYGCAFDASGNLVTTGIFSATVDFGGGPLVSAGMVDGFVVKFVEPVVDTTPPEITCPASIEVEQTTAEGTPATHPAIVAFLSGGSASDDIDPAPTVTPDAPAVFPPGVTSVTFTALDASGNTAECAATVTVLDATDPEIDVVLDKTLLWPPNHKFVTVCAEVDVADNGNTETSFTLVSIASDEDPNGKGDGNTSPDVRNAEFGSPDLCFDLRAERAGNGDGRIYQIIYGTTDAAGNAAYDTVEVRVPHDMSGNTIDNTASLGSATIKSVYPNPFNPQTTLAYALSSEERVRIVIYDARGAVVRTLVDQRMSAGDHLATWTGVDQSNRPVGSGIYFVKMTAGSHTETRKLVLLK